MANGTEGAIGELLRQLTGTFQQGRDFNLQKANARASAAIRIQQFQLDKEKRGLEEERTRQSISASQTEQKIKEFGLTEDIKAEKRVRQLEKTIASSQLIGPRQISDPAPSGEQVAGAFEELGRPVPASLEARVAEGALTEPQRRARDLDIESKEVGIEATRALTGKRGLSELPPVEWDRQSPKDKLKITNTFENIKFGDIDFPYNNAEIWFNTEILGQEGNQDRSGIEELKSLGYTIEDLNDPNVAGQLNEAGYNVEAIKQGWNAK